MNIKMGSTQCPQVSPSDIEAVIRISTEFGFLIDHGRATECQALFLQESKLIFGPGSPKPGTIEGIAAIREFLSGRQDQTHVTTRHSASNFRASQLDKKTLVLDSLLTLFRSIDESRQTFIASVSDIEEVYRCDEQGVWRISERKTTPVFVST